MSKRDVMTLLADANPVRVADLPRIELPASILVRRRAPNRLIPVAASVVLAAGAAVSIAVLRSGSAGSPTRASTIGSGHRTIDGPGAHLALPGVPDLHVGSAAAADALLPFRVVLPSARPLVLEVSPPKPPAYVTHHVHQLVAFFATPATGPYVVVEQPANHLAGIWMVSQLREWANTCRSRVICPIHKVVEIDGTHVLLIGAPGRPGGLTVWWLRHDRARSVLTWVQGPEDYAHGDLSHHRFRPRAALAVAADMIRRGG